MQGVGGGAHSNSLNPSTVFIIEHEGPGIYDEEFIHYLMLILEKASNYGIQCFIGKD